MTGPGKLFLILGVIAISGLLLIGGAAWYWWDQHSAELFEAARASVEDGQKRGSKLEEGDCIVHALERHKADWNRTMVSVIKNGLWLTGCLDVSKLQPRFCEEVPSQDNPVLAGIWAGNICVQQGLSDHYCHTLFQNVSKYCHSPERAAKIKTGVRPGPMT
jgi:hypothetical protein